MSHFAMASLQTIKTVHCTQKTVLLYCIYVLPSSLPLSVCLSVRPLLRM